MTWQLTQVGLGPPGSSLTPELRAELDAEMDRLMAEGWEPFSASYIGQSAEGDPLCLYHFRRYQPDGPSAPPSWRESLLV